MSDDEIDKAVKEAAEFEAQDKKRKEAIDARNDAESFVFQTEDALKQVGDSVDAADKSAVEADIAAVKSFLDAHKEAEAMTEAMLQSLRQHRRSSHRVLRRYLQRCMSRLRQRREQQEQDLT